MDFGYFVQNCRLTAIDLSNQTKLKDRQQVSFIGKFENQAFGATMFFIIEKSEQTTFNFTKFCMLLTVKQRAFISVTGGIAVTRTIDNPIQRNQQLAAATQIAFKNQASFEDCKTEINGTFVN